MQREEIISQWDKPHAAIFSSTNSRKSIASILSFAKDHASQSRSSLFPTRLLIVGMPNVGKSSLLNALRNVSLNKGKAARIGDQPGVTRKIGSTVKIVESTDQHEGVYVLDTPGVFIPYVPDAESMLKLALCGNVKDTIIPPISIADYLLYHLNLHDPKLYGTFCQPTNEIGVVLESLARKQGRLKKGGIPDFEASALQLIQRWRSGEMGRFMLDDVSEEAFEKKADILETQGSSVNQARKAEKQAKLDRLRSVA